MREHSVVTFRVMFNTDQQEKADNFAEILEHLIRGWGADRIGRPTDVLDVEITGHEFVPGRSFRTWALHEPGSADLYMEPRTKP